MQLTRPTGLQLACCGCSAGTKSSTADCNMHMNMHRAMLLAQEPHTAGATAARQPTYMYVGSALLVQQKAMSKTHTRTACSLCANSSKQVCDGHSLGVKHPRPRGSAMRRGAKKPKALQILSVKLSMPTHPRMVDTLEYNCCSPVTPRSARIFPAFTASCAAVAAARAAACFSVSAPIIVSISRRAAPSFATVEARPNMPRTLGTLHSKPGALRAGMVHCAYFPLLTSLIVLLSQSCLLSVSTHSPCMEAHRDGRVSKGAGCGLLKPNCCSALAQLPLLTALSVCCDAHSSWGAGLHSEG